MKYICINLECDTNSYFEEHDIVVYHQEHQSDVLKIDDAAQIISNNIKKIKILIENLNSKLSTLEITQRYLMNQKDFDFNEKIALQYSVLHLYQLDDSNDKISFHKTLISQTESINSISQSYFKSFKPQFQELLENLNIWELHCQNHHLEPLHSLVLQSNYNKSRLQCLQDDVQQGKKLIICQDLLKNYNQYEICFAGMIKLREKIKHLRIQFDQFTRNIQEQLTSIIELNYPKFNEYSIFFQQNLQLKHNERMLNHEKLEKIALFLSQISENGIIKQIFNNQQIEDVQIYISIFESIENTINNKQKINLIEQNLIMISLEIIQNSNVQGYQLQIQANATLNEIFQWTKDNNLILPNVNLTQINLHINYVSYNIKQINCYQRLKQEIQSQFLKIQFKNNDLIQFEL